MVINNDYKEGTLISDDLFYYLTKVKLPAMLKLTTGIA